MELQLSVPSSSAHEAAPLPHPAFLRCGDAPDLEVSDEEEGNAEEECVRNILVVLNLEMHPYQCCYWYLLLGRLQLKQGE